MARPTLPILALASVVIALGCAGDSPGDDPRGRACASDAECDELRCRAEPDAEPEDLTPLPLVCGDPDEAGDPGDACETGAGCARGICLLSGACAEPCDGPSTCRDGERCQRVYARAGAAALQSLTACVALADLPAGVEVESELREDALEPELTELDLPGTSAETTLYVVENLEDNWPDGTLCRPPLCVRALRTRDADPVLLFDATADYATADAPLNPVATGAHLHPAVIMVPNGSPAARTAAGYTVELAIEHPGDARVTRIAGPGGGQQLDLNLFYVGALDLAPEGDRGPPLVAEALEIVDAIFAQADIFIGEVRQIAVPGELPLRGEAFPDGDASQGFATLQLRFGVYVELPYLFRLSAGAANPAVDLFFVSEIEPRSPGAEPEAEAGGIPGPLGMHGTGASGIAISTDMMAGNPTMLGRTLAHELAHYLGLFHTSEADGRVFDPLADTPECRLDRDAGGDGLSVDDCRDAGADNLMFWAKTTGTVLTPEQRAVLRRAPILR